MEQPAAEQPALSELHDSYVVSRVAKDICLQTDPAIVGNEIVSSGKDSLIQEIIKVSGGRYVWVPSRKTRELRIAQGEKEGVAQISVSLPQAKEGIAAGQYLEWVPMRDKDVYGTHAGDLWEYHLKEGKRPIIDVEPRGQAALREVHPDIKSVYPLPDLDLWLEMLHLREQLPGASVKEFLATEPDVLDTIFYLSNGYDGEMAKKHADIKKRLQIAAEQRDIVSDLNMHRNPNVLFVVNSFGRLSRAAVLADLFLRDGRGMQHATSDCPTGRGLFTYLDRVRTLADDALSTAA